MRSKLFDTDDFWKRINDDINKGMHASMGCRAVVDAIEDHNVRLKDIRDQPLGVAPYVGFEKLEAGDDVWIEPVGRLIHGSVTKVLSWVVVGKIYPGPGSLRFLEGQNITLIDGMDIFGSPDDGSTISWSLGGTSGDGSFGNVVVKSLNAIIPFGDSQTSSDDGATSSTTVWNNAMTYSLALPEGTWTVVAIGFIDILHSANNRGHIRVMIDGDTTGEANSPSAPATSPDHRTIKATHTLVGISGNRSINIIPQFKSVDAGTTTANNPLVFGQARRTA